MICVQLKLLYSLCLVKYKMGELFSNFMHNLWIIAEILLDLVNFVRGRKEKPCKEELSEYWKFMEYEFFSGLPRNRSCKQKIFLKETDILHTSPRNAFRCQKNFYPVWISCKICHKDYAKFLWWSLHTVRKLKKYFKTFYLDSLSLLSELAN